MQVSGLSENKDVTGVILKSQHERPVEDPGVRRDERGGQRGPLGGVRGLLAEDNNLYKLHSKTMVKTFLQTII